VISAGVSLPAFTPSTNYIQPLSGSRQTSQTNAQMLLMGDACTLSPATVTVTVQAGSTIGSLADTGLTCSLTGTTSTCTSTGSNANNTITAGQFIDVKLVLSVGNTPNPFYVYWAIGCQ
jgi:hypothetical protein